MLVLVLCFLFDASPVMPFSSEMAALVDGKGPVLLASPPHFFHGGGFHEIATPLVVPTANARVGSGTIPTKLQRRTPISLLVSIAACFHCMYPVGQGHFPSASIFSVHP